MTTAETWRVVCEGGEVREVAARKRRSDWIPSVDGPEFRADGTMGRFAYGSSLRIAVANLAIESRWPVVEIVAPGAQTSDERLAQVTSERDAAVAHREALAGAVREMIAASDDRIMGMADNRRVYAARTALDAAIAEAIERGPTGGGL